MSTELTKSFLMSFKNNFYSSSHLGVVQEDLKAPLLKKF